jgi:hypothetical protein
LSDDQPAIAPPESPSSVDDALRHSEGLPCPGCGGVTSADAQVFEAYFRGRLISCWQCSETFDWWDRAVEFTSAWPENWTAFCLVGATTVFKDVDLPPDRAIQINCADLGVPPEAEILRLQYSPVVPGEQRGPLPFEITGWEARIRTVPHVLWLYGATYGQALRESSTMKVAVTFTVHGPNEIPARSLAAAACQYSAGRYHALLVPANVAVEAAIYQVADIALRGFVGNGIRRGFLDGAVTYSHQLNVLVPLICHMTGAPALGDNLRGQLNRLRSLRNEMAHDGEPETQLSKKDAAQLLISAVFGFHYASLLRAEIERAQAEGRLPRALQAGNRT